MRKSLMVFPVEMLREILHYEGESGKMFWKRRNEVDCEWWSKNTAKRFNAQFVGREAGFLRSVKGREYLRREIKLPNGKNYLTHRVVWAYQTGEWPNDDIDHIDQNPLNNRIENLRMVDNGENQRNSTRRKDNTSGIVGVYFNKNDRRWVASISYNGEKYWKTSKDFFEACCFRKSMELQLGFSKNHGRERTNVRRF